LAFKEVGEVALIRKATSESDLGKGQIRFEE
jgi:hypothetical protein